MRNITKFLGIIAAVAVIGFVTGCGEPDPDDRIEIQITGLPSSADGYYARVSLFKTAADAASVARSSAAKGISANTATSEMIQSGKNFATEGSYFVRLEIYNHETIETIDRRLYDAMTSANRSIVKGTNVIDASLFGPPAIKADMFPTKGTPAPDVFGTYSGKGYQNATETIVLKKDSFHVSDAVPIADYLKFKITKWEEVGVPEGLTGYTGGYKFTGKITGATVEGSNLYGSQTAPNFSTSDIADENGTGGTEAWMAIYFSVDTETNTIVFIRTKFNKGTGNDTSIVQTNSVNRVYRVVPTTP